MSNKKKILLVMMAVLMAVTLISCQKSAGSSAEADQAAPAEKLKRLSGSRPVTDRLATRPRFTMTNCVMLSQKPPMVD